MDAVLCSFVSVMIASIERFVSASMDVCIFMRDRSGIHCTLEEGHNAEAEDLFDIVLQEQGFPQECEDVFALWLVSPLIGKTLILYSRSRGFLQSVKMCLPCG